MQRFDRQKKKKILDVRPGAGAETRNCFAVVHREILSSITTTSQKQVLDCW